MADLRQVCAIVLAFMILFSLLGSWRTREKPAEVVSHNVTELDRKVYLGHWEAQQNAFGVLTDTSGRIYFAAEQVGANNFTAFFLLYDGDWEDDQVYKFVIRNSTFNESARKLELGNNLLLLDNNHAKIDSKSQVDYEIEGELSFTPSQDLYDVSGFLTQNEFDIDFDMDQLTEEVLIDGKVAYASIFTVINFFTFYGFLQHLKLCVRSESYAKQTSIVFLAMNACIDLFLSLWHLRLSLAHYACFDYLIMASIWSFIVFVIVQSKLVRVVWRAQNQTVVDFVRPTQGQAFERREYNVFNTRLFIVISTVVLTAIALDSLYMFNIAAMHCFFIPQIISNTTNNHKNSVKPTVYLSIAAGRLALVLYIFGCPANFLIWKPKYEFVGAMAAVILLQVLILTLQGVCGPRFMLPKRFKPQVYSYYKAFTDELEMAELTECNICLSVIDSAQVRVMTTPCDHRFHNDCLTHWMSIKLQCPTCRAELPSIEE